MKDDDDGDGDGDGDDDDTVACGAMAIIMTGVGF